jgi:hypothetical protein
MREQVKEPKTEAHSMKLRLAWIATLILTLSLVDPNGRTMPCLMRSTKDSRQKRCLCLQPHQSL